MLATVLLSLTLAAPPARSPVVAVLPVQADASLAGLGLLVEARTLELLAASSDVVVLDGKQVRAMASQESLDLSRTDDGLLEAARSLLGADVVVRSALLAKGGLSWSGVTSRASGVTHFEGVTKADWPTALRVTSLALATAARDGRAPDATTAQPESGSEPALKALAACWEVALRQPMSIEAPSAVAGQELETAMRACQAALKADPSLRFASATLALLQGIAREDTAAEKTLGTGADTDPALIPWAIARVWLLTRHTSNDAALGFLTGVVKRHPNRLVLRSFLASTAAAMNEQERARAGWTDYLSLAPASPFAHGRLSRAQARLGKTDLALETAKKGLALAPQSLEAQVTLAARQVDAGKLKEARASLEPLVKRADAPAEPFLQLGQAAWLANDLGAAQAMFQAALDRAKGPRAWRINGRASYGLALVAAKQKRTTDAKALLAKVAESGFVVRDVDPLLAGLSTPAAAGGGGEGGERSLYVSLEFADEGAGLSPAASSLADGLLRERLGGLGAAFAPAGEDKATALKAITSRHLKGYLLRVKAGPHPSATGLKVEMLVMSYPEQALKGSWSVKAQGGKPETLLKAMVPRVVDDVAQDLEWR